ncbi:translation initiation factor IF-2-like [Panthera leo]|uniref:translation initiation factor IF-2-like n=1 Tax=Panthera leo TaxID=9689 RepID=UPI001C69DAF6|nr:translation initiation factor IF-2-like [Panthera leo]
MGGFLDKRKWRPPKGDAQPHRISDWYPEVPRPVDLCRPHPAAGQPGNFLNSAPVSGLRPPGPAPPSVALRGGSFQGEPDSSLLAEDVFLRSGQNISGTFRRGLNSLSTLAAFGVPGRAQTPGPLTVAGQGDARRGAGCPVRRQLARPVPGPVASTRGLGAHPAEEWSSVPEQTCSGGTGPERRGQKGGLP